MKYLYSKEEFLSVQDKLYDAIEDILKDNRITNIDYNLIERGLFYKPDKKIIINRKYTANVYAWLKEIKFLKGNIFEELLLCLAYNKIFDKFDSPLRNSLKFIIRERYLKLAVYDLFTFREKLAFLIYEVFNRQIKIYSTEYRIINNKVEKERKLNNLKRNEVNFNKINNGLKIIDTPNENFTWISDNEIKLIKDIINQFSTNESVRIFREIRHPFTHRSNPGIDCFPLESFEYKKVDDLTRNILLRMDEKKGVKNAEKFNYITASAIPLEKQMSFEDVMCDTLNTWKLFVNGLGKLLKNVSILKEQVIVLN